MPLYRPPSLSDSLVDYSFTIDYPAEQTIQKIDSLKKPKSKWESFLVRYCLRFSFHLLLIGFFETIFFFYFVSTQENSGLNKDIDIFLYQLTSHCQNFTEPEKEIFDGFLNLFVNRTEIINNGTYNAQIRNQTNHTLFIQAWVYEVCLFIIFLGFTAYSRYKKIKINWRRIFLENLALISFLGLYEYLFFSTVVFNYMPLTAYELEANALQQIENVC